MQQERDGYWNIVVDNVPAGSRYWYRLDRERDLPDPASRWQPDGVHGPSAVTDPTRFAWHNNHWRGIRLSELVCYELHVGTFTPEGTFTAIIPHLPALVDLGITAIELMPVAEFPGERNWGYDGVLPFAVHHAYGGPEGLRHFVDACHQHGLGVILDIVYNHVGPEGNVLNQYGPYFTERYRTPWGPALNTDGPDSEPVRRFLIENALHWVREYHIDGFRLDAVHAIVDQLPTHILEELAQTLHAEGLRLSRHILVIAESDTNDPRIITPRPLGGYGLDAVWSDDFHHALHTLITGEQHGYYVDYGSLEHLARVFRHGFCYTGQRSTFRRRRHGRAAPAAHPEQFVVCIQNHD
jgi:maltooligosyltrehalose trehalohydrolase